MTDTFEVRCSISYCSWLSETHS